MNISTLSQQLNMSVQELRERMAGLGVVISPRQRKIDNHMAREVIEKLRKESPQKMAEVIQEPLGPKKISIPPQIVVKELASKMRAPVVDVIRVLIKNGVMAAMNEEVDFDTASVVAQDFGFEVEIETTKTSVLGTGYVAQVISGELADAKESSHFTSRPPIVAVMGHVDHGKSTLLDTIRGTSVVAGEAGGITQHIGAYQIQHNDKLITFLDTPGHEAFTQMRARGANVTDIIILVVAADDGVKPQTVEVINRARLANVPMIVAINKIDKPEANPERVKQQLSELGVLIEGWGGKTIAVPISAKKGEGLKELLDYVLLVSEVENFKANPKGQVVGTVIESHISRGQGPVATVIVQNGTLRVGDFILAGRAYGRIRSLEVAGAEKVKSVGPATPVLVMGLSESPQAGDIFRIVSTLDEARSEAREYELYIRGRRFMNPGITVSGKNLNLIIKADVQGSLEAIVQALDELKARSQEVNLVVVDKGVGEINEGDVLRAESAHATVIGFGTKVAPAAQGLAKSKDVTIDLYNVIYELLEDVTKALVSMLSPEVVKSVSGRAKILAVFRTDGNNQIVGGRVEENKITSKGKFVFKRDGEEIGSGEVQELQQNKQVAKEVSAPSEFGLKVETTIKITEGDVLEFYTEEVKARKLS